MILYFLSICNTFCNTSHLMIVSLIEYYECICYLFVNFTFDFNRDDDHHNLFRGRTNNIVWNNNVSIVDMDALTPKVIPLCNVSSEVGFHTNSWVWRRLQVTEFYICPQKEEHTGSRFSKQVFFHNITGSELKQ